MPLPSGASAEAAPAPENPVMVEREIPPSLPESRIRYAIQAALASVSTRDSAGRNALSSFRNINGFMPALDPHYKGVRTVDEEVSAALEASGNALPPLLPIEPPASP